MNTQDLGGLRVAEKLRIVAQRWDEIASSPEPIRVPAVLSAKHRDALPNSTLIPRSPLTTTSYGDALMA